MKMKRWLSLLMAFLITAVYASGCSSASKDSTANSTFGNATEASQVSETTKPSEGNTGEVINLTLWHNRAGSAGEILEQDRIPAFNQGLGAELRINITPVYQGDDIISKIKAVSQANDVKNLPDLIQIYAGDVEYMSTVPYVIPMEEFIANDPSFDMGDILSQLINTYTFSDVLYSMPFHASTLMFYWNKTAFAEAGLDPDKPPATIAEMAEIAPKLMKKEGEAVTQYAITLGIVNNYLNHWISGQGEYSFLGNNESGRAGRMTKVTFDENGTMAKFLNEWKKVLDTGAVQYVEEGNQQRDEFNAGLSAMVVCTNNGLASIKTMSKEMGFEFGVAALPKVDPNDTGGVCPGGSSVYILDKGNQGSIDASWEFVKYWVSPENQYEWCMQSGNIPVNAKTFDLPEMQTFIAEDPYYIEAYNCMMASHPKVQEHLSPAKPAFETIFKEVGFQFSDGQLAVDEAVALMAEQCNAALDEYNRANPIN